MKPNNTLKMLLAQQNIALQNNETFLSIYHEIRNPSKTIIKTEVRNLVVNAFKKYGFDDVRGIYRTIADQIAGIINAQEVFQNSIGIFLRIDLSDDKKIPPIELNENLFFIFSDTPVEEYSYVGKIFDLTSAIRMLQQDSNSLVINISWERILIYKTKADDFEKVKEIENEILEAMEDRYTGMHTTGENTFIHQGSATHEKQDKFTTMILNNLFQEMEELPDRFSNNQKILVFSSPDFLSQQNKIINSLKKYSTSEAIVVQKTLKLEDDIKDQAKKELELLRKEEKGSELKNLKTSTLGSFAEDWENVAKAAREARIYKLFIKEGYREPGFVLDNDLPYITEEDNVEPVDNISPWIIKKVFETDGEIVVLAKDNSSIDFPVFAALRF